MKRRIQVICTWEVTTEDPQGVLQAFQNDPVAALKSLPDAVPHEALATQECRWCARTITVGGRHRCEFRLLNADKVVPNARYL